LRFALCFLALPFSRAAAQQTDSLGVTRAQQILPDTLATPPLSPGRAFLGSLLLPGYSQSVMRRPTAMVIFSAVEGIGVAMLWRSLDDLSRAKRFARDSVVSAYRINSQTGLVERDPGTNEPIVQSYEENPYRSGLITARRKHVEDWAAIVVFNHLLSGVDALVATHLLEVSEAVRIRAVPEGGVQIGARIRW
jgi:hypothetical protein